MRPAAGDQQYLPFGRLAYQPIPEVRRIAVLRGGGMGDLLMAMPALSALKGCYPAATLTLLGTPGGARLLDRRPGPVDEVLTLPVATGVHEPPGAVADEPAVRRFVDRARNRRFDLAVQLHGGGRWSNPFVRRLTARVTVGSRTQDAEPLDRWLPYDRHQHETLRALEVVGMAGAPAVTLEPRLAVLPGDLAAADRVLAPLPPTVLALHPGARDPRRRWPAERFAAVAAAVAREGAGVAVLGSAGDADLARRVAQLAARRLPLARHGAVLALAGSLDESSLVGVLARSAALLGNDSGPRHLAAAVGTPTVAVYWVGNLIGYGPLSRHVHRVHVGWTLACPVCGRSGADDRMRCQHDESFVDEVDAESVLADVRALLGGPQRPTTAYDRP
jgi:ADP-heptose:LPS heptosyltransferase